MPTSHNDICVLRYDVRPSDRDAVRSIVEHTGFFRDDEVDVAVELVDEHLARGLASGYHFVFAESNELVVGYACYGPIACTAASYDLYWIAVDPTQQGQGMGRRLMQAAESRIAAARGHRIYLDTSGQPKYAPTRAFYERSGFRHAARLVDFYAPGDDRLIYEKVIAEESQSKDLSQNRRGLAGHHRRDGRAESAEQNVPVPLSADDFGIGPK